jgi:hypothetical protein
VYSTRVDREITSTVTVTESLETIPAAAVSPSGDIPTPETNTTSTIDAGTDGSMYVQTTGVFQGTPSFPEASATESTTPPTANPTAPAFTCPEDNGMTISQMLGTERSDYDVYCDTDLPSSPDIPIGLSYDSFAQCVAACSLSNMQFPGGPVCQGVSYFEANGNNCFLKSAANASDSVPATGVDIAILKRIAVGIDEQDPDGTNTQTVTFDDATPTVNPSELGSMLGAAMGNSTSTVSIMEPPAIITGRPAMDGVTAYSTFVSDGETVSTGSVYSTYYSANGSWYYSYYSTWSLAWTDAQTIYAAGETSVPVAVNNTGVTEQHNGGDGEYSVITTSNTTTISYQANQTVYDTTELVGNDTYDANGTQIFETTATHFYTYTQAVAGGNGGGDAGVVTSTAVSAFSTNYVIYSSGVTGGQNGGQGSGGQVGGQGSGQVIQTPGPTSTSTSAFSTRTVNLSSGDLSGGEGGQGSGAAGSTVPVEGVTSTITSAFSTETVIVSSGNTAGGQDGEVSGGQGSIIPITIGSSVVLVTGGTAYATGGIISGAYTINGTSGATGAVGSGAIITPVPFTDTPVFLSTGGTGKFFGTGGQGSGAGGEGATSTGGAGFTNSQRPRSGTESDSTSFPATESLPSVTAPAPYPPLSTVSSGVLTSLNASLPAPTGTAPGSFTNSQRPRSGTESLTSDIGIGLVPYPPLSTPPGSFTNSERPRSGTESLTSDLGTGPIPYPPLSTAPSSGVTPLVNSSIPVPTGTAPGLFSNSEKPRSGTESIPLVSLPTPITLSYPTGTGPVAYPPIVQTLSFPTVTGPLLYPPLSTGPSASIPIGTGPVPYQPLSSAPSASIPSYNSSLSIPTGTSPPGNQTLPASTGALTSLDTFTNSNRPRSGTQSTSSQSVTSRPPIFQTLSYGPFPTPPVSGSSIALSTGGSSNATFPPFPTGTATPATSCPSETISTTTIWATQTVLGCYDVCPQGKNGGYGGYGGPPSSTDHYQGPQSFGPPTALFAPTLSGDPNPPPTSPAETSS